MATLKQVRDKADAKLAQFWSILEAKQEAYRLKNDKYFQLLFTGSRQVDSGQEYDFIVRKPSDEKNPDDIDITVTSRIPFEIQVDEWVGEGKTGYSATVTVEYLGRIFTRTRDNSQNDTGWSEIDVTATI